MISRLLIQGVNSARLLRKVGEISVNNTYRYKRVKELMEKVKPYLTKAHRTGEVVLYLYAFQDVMDRILDKKESLHIKNLMDLDDSEALRLVRVADEVIYHINNDQELLQDEKEDLITDVYVAKGLCALRVSPTEAAEFLYDLSNHLDMTPRSILLLIELMLGITGYKMSLKAGYEALEIMSKF